MKTLLIFTDTTRTQINGVTRCIEHLQKNSPSNISLKIVSTDDFISLPFIGYKEIRLSLAFPQKILKIIRNIQPDYIHIKTEGPIGLVAAAVCKKHNIPYTTTFHTKFPEYLNLRSKFVKEDYVHAYLHYIHDGAQKVFISNKGMVSYLQNNGYSSHAIVPLGIDHTVFFPSKASLFNNTVSPKILFVGRIALEKNIEHFLQISDNYTKIVVGDGPQRSSLSHKYPQTQFLGIKKGKELADIYRSVDVFVFPSKTDTLGLVNLEAIACGIPVVAYDIDTMRGIIDHQKNGILVSENGSLESGVELALELDTRNIADSVAMYGWDNYVQQFYQFQSPIPDTLWTYSNG